MIEESDRQFVAYLKSLAASDNRGALAALRRGLGKPPGSEPLMYPYIIPQLPARSVQDEAPYYLVASLFALHPLAAQGHSNLGGHLRELWKQSRADAHQPRQEVAAAPHLRELWKQSGADEPPPNIERRFTMLLAAHPNDLYKLIQPVVNLLKTGNVAIDWTGLLHDLRHWQHAEKRSEVRYAWAYEFWKREAQNQLKSQSERSQ